MGTGSSTRRRRSTDVEALLTKRRDHTRESSLVASDGVLRRLWKENRSDEHDALEHHSDKGPRVQRKCDLPRLSRETATRSDPPVVPVVVSQSTRMGITCVEEEAMTPEEREQREVGVFHITYGRLDHPKRQEALDYVDGKGPKPEVPITFCMTLDSKDRVKEYTRGRELLTHNDFFREEAPPYRTICGAEAMERFRQFRILTCRRFTEMLDDPEHAESAARTIQRMKDRGTWIDVDD